ncbi:MAG: DUF2591 domain-containing protein [Alcaligenaceae bacterium]|nr:MAG: DUF2591 domain-containing protein [Alcaligenaceae bacterium]
MKVSELNGSTLNTWAAKAGGKPEGPAYSTSWADAGPLIEKYHIHIAPMPGKGYIWCATTVNDSDRGTWVEGNTPLVAAMRALVASRYGVEVPA